MWYGDWRDRIWSQLDTPWDLVVIGGGITGAGIMNEAVKLGLRVLLVDASDFAAGTSSRSSKLVHGGLRYLKNGQLKTTIASVHERERLLKEYRGLVSPLSFLYASYDRDKLPLWVMGLGLALYDILGIRWGHKRYNPNSILKLNSYLNPTGLVGGYRYFDAQTDDARLVLRVIQEAVQSGGVALNYACAERILKSKDGQVEGLILHDLAHEKSRTIEIHASSIVNATGSAADSLRAQIGGKSRLRRLRGSHLVFKARNLPLLRAVSFSHPVDGRPVFAIPWEGVTIFGTTDVDHDQGSDTGPAINSDELDYLLTAIMAGFPELHLSEKDVQATFSGVRAVIDTGKLNPSKESREHVLWSEEGLLTVSGGKLTTFRAMAQDALRLIIKRLPSRLRLGHENRLRGEEMDLSLLASLEPAVRLRLLGRYGTSAISLVTAAHEGELSPIDEDIGSRALWAEVRWAARTEGVVHLEDLMLRRVRLGLLLPNGGMDQMPCIRSIVQEELGWDDRRWLSEEKMYCQNWRANYGLPR